MDKINNFLSYGFLGAIVTIIVSVYFRLKGLSKENQKLKDEKVDSDLESIARNNKLRSISDLVGRANDFWKRK